MSARRRLMLIAAAALAVALLAAAGIRIYGDDVRRELGGLPAGPDQATPGAVLLVPGYGGGRASLDRLADRLRATGRTAAVLKLPGDGTGDLLQQADALDDAVREALDDGAPSVDVIGYSAGGVVARVWVDRHDGQDVARRVVTLGSPLHGAKIAGVGALFAPGSCPAACRQLAPGSDLLTELADTPLPARLPWLSIWTENDETVQPPDSARLPGAVNVSLQSVCPGARVTHGALPTDPLVTALVLRGIGVPAPTVPAGCAELTSS